MLFSLFVFLCIYAVLDFSNSYVGNIRFCYTHQHTLTFYYTISLSQSHLFISIFTPLFLSGFLMFVPHSAEKGSRNHGDHSQRKKLRTNLFHTYFPSFLSGIFTIWCSNRKAEKMKFFDSYVVFVVCVYCWCVHMCKRCCPGMGEFKVFSKIIPCVVTVFTCFNTWYKNVWHDLTVAFEDRIMLLLQNIRCLYLHVTLSATEFLKHCYLLWEFFAVF